MNSTHRNYLFVACAVGILAWGCGSSKKSGGDEQESSSGNDPSGGTPAGSATNTLATIYPGGLSITVFPDDRSALTLMQTVSDDKTPTMAAKAKEAEAILKGDRACAGSIFQRQVKAPKETCYEFDQEMIYGGRILNPTFSGTKDGKNGLGEACLVAFSRSQVKEVEFVIDRALGVVQAMLCQAKKAGKASSLPAVGETVDLAAILKEALGDKAARVSKAAITRIADKDGRPVYRSDVTMEGKNGDVQETHLVHSPASDSDNGTYDGVLWTKMSGLDKLGGPAAQQPPGDGPKDPYMSVQYSKTMVDGKPRLKAQLLRARVVDALAPNVFKNGVLDLNVANNSSNEYQNPAGGTYFRNQALSGMTFIGVNVDPDTGAGAVSYWQNPGSNFTESARGMVFNLSASAANGSLSGCGLTGARKGGDNSPGNGMSIRKAIKEDKLGTLVPNGFYHPFFNTESTPPNQDVDSCTSVSGQDYDYQCSKNSQVVWVWSRPEINNSSFVADWVTKQMGSAVSRQCVTQNVATGLYEIDRTKIAEDAGFVLIDGANPGSTDKVDAPDLSGLKSFEIN